MSCRLRTSKRHKCRAACASWALLWQPIHGYRRLAIVAGGMPIAKSGSDTHDVMLDAASRVRETPPTHATSRLAANDSGEPATAFKAFSLRRTRGGRRPDEGCGHQRSCKRPLTPTLCPCSAKGEGASNQAPALPCRLPAYGFKVLLPCSSLCPLCLCGSFPSRPSRPRRLPHR